MKLKIISGDKSRLKHEAVKLIVMMVARNKKAKIIYSEEKILSLSFPFKKNKIVDVYFVKDKDNYAVEIQKDMGGDYLEKMREFYSNLEMTPIIIDLNKMPEDINKIWAEVEKLI